MYRGSRANITAAPIKKKPHWKSFTVFELSGNMRIGQEKSLQRSGQMSSHIGKWRPTNSRTA